MSLGLTSFQTTEHGPALARRSLWVSVPGAPQRATFSDAFVAPCERRVQHVALPWRVLAGRTLSRGGRFPLADRHSRLVACDRPHTLSAGRFRLCVKASRSAGSVGLSCPVCVCQDQPGYLSETHHLLNPLHVPEQSHTWRTNTCSVNANNCS